MKILIYNQNWFAAEWRAQGHDVITMGMANHLDVVLSKPLIHIDQALNEAGAGYRPDVIVVHDNSAPVALIGLNETDIPTLFYSVDIHHHVNYHKYLANLFDIMVVAQQDYLPLFQGISEPPHWMPLWASRWVDAAPARDYDAVFVGNLDLKLNPDRVKFFEELQKRVPVLCTMGEYWNIFPFSEIVINQTVKGDLNFRVFEAMMCGSALLTERSGNGLFQLFNDGEHLVSYEKGNSTDAAEKITELLTNRTRAREIAQAGREEILRKHLASHRADQLMLLMQGIQKKNAAMKHLGSFMNFCTLARRIEKLDYSYAGQACITALRAAELALEHEEPLTQEITFNLIACTAQYDRIIRSGAGAALIERFAEAYPDELILQLGRIRHTLNSGRRQEALQLAENLAAVDAATTFTNAEKVISSILTDLADTP